MRARSSNNDRDSASRERNRGREKRKPGAPATEAHIRQERKSRRQYNGASRKPRAEPLVETRPSDFGANRNPTPIPRKNDDHRQLPDRNLSSDIQKTDQPPNEKLATTPTKTTNATNASEHPFSARPGG